MRPRSGDPTQTAVQTLDAVQLAMPMTLVCKSWRAAVDSVLYRRVASSSLLGCAHLCRSLWGRSELLEAVRGLDISIPASSVDSFAMLLGGLDGLESLNVYLSDEDDALASTTMPASLQVQPSSSLAGALMGVHRLRRLSFLSSAAFDLNALLSVGGPDLRYVDVSGLAITTSFISGPPAHIQTLVLREPSPQLAQMLVHLPRGVSRSFAAGLISRSPSSPSLRPADRTGRRPDHVQIGRRLRASAPRDPGARDRPVVQPRAH